MGKGAFMMRKILVSLFLVSIMVFGFASVSSAANWKWIVSTNTVTIFFDAANINGTPSDKQYSVWTKYAFTESEGQKLMSKFNYDKPVSYALYYEQFDYNNHASRTSVAVYYAKDGSALANYNFQNAFSPIIPETIQEQVFVTTFTAYAENNAGK